MPLIPTSGEILDILRRTGGLRDGHFEYPQGWHSNQHVQIPLAMRQYDVAKFLSVSLSRLIRADTEIRAMIPELSIVAPATGGMPVAYGVSEALRAPRVYWAENRNEEEPLRFRIFLELEPGEKVLLVDDIIRTGSKLKELKTLVESKGGEVVGAAVILNDPLPGAADFGELPFFHIAQSTATYYPDAESCALCRKGEPVAKVWI